MKLIITADWHIRPDTPRCRKDEDWIRTQTEQIQFVINQARKHEAMLIIAGDIFHKSQISDYIKNILIDLFSNSGIEIHAITGNHDLLNHSWENFNKSSLSILFNAGIVSSPKMFSQYKHFGQIIKGNDKSNVLFLHEPIFASEQDCPPGMKAKTAVQVFEEYPDAKWIFCGDIHKGFHVKKQGKHLIMAGCLNRQASDYIDYEPVIWYVDTDSETVERIPVPDDVNMITDEHIQEKNDREDRISAFVTQVRNSKSITLDFENNVREAMKESGLSEGAINTVNELMEVV